MDIPEGYVPLYMGDADDPNRKQIGWAKIANTDVEGVFIGIDAAELLSGTDIIDLSIVNRDEVDDDIYFTRPPHSG